MFALIVGMCLLNTFRLFILHPTDPAKYGLTHEDVWILSSKRRYHQALAARRARPLAAICIANA